ncbi:MAG TPA: malate dehydrogenase [Armatimonadota bacterium]|jgi:malate dehydrogenase
MKVTVVGAGNVGATCAQRLVEGDLADVYLVDVVEGLARGKALDLAQAAPLLGHSRVIEGGESYEGAAGSDVVVVTAGIARKPGMSRDDLLTINGKIVTEVSENLKRVCPAAIVIMVANPLDVTTHLAAQVFGAPRERIMGMAGALDTARYQTFIAWAVGCAPYEVQAMVLGGHGDSMVPLPRLTAVNGTPLDEILDAETIAAIVERTANGGAEIVSHLKTGSAFYAPSAAVVDMVKAIARDEHRIVPCAVQLQGEYGLEGLFLGVPARLGAAGVEEVVEIYLNEEELAALHASAQHVRDTVAAWENLPKG